MINAHKKKKVSFYSIIVYMDSSGGLPRDSFNAAENSVGKNTALTQRLALHGRSSKLAVHLHPTLWAESDLLLEKTRRLTFHLLSLHFSSGSHKLLISDSAEGLRRDPTPPPEKPRLPSTPSMSVGEAGH